MATIRREDLYRVMENVCVGLLMLRDEKGLFIRVGMPDTQKLEAGVLKLLTEFAPNEVTIFEEPT